MKWDKLKSRKFLVTIGSAVLYGINLVVLDNPYTTEQIMPVVVVIVGWLFSQGWVDGKEVGRTEVVAVKSDSANVKADGQPTIKVDNCTFETK
jgi:hypothetical protein